METILFLDFDGTITEQDTCDMLMERYGNAECLELNRRWERKEISTMECARQSFRQMQVTPEVLKRLVQEVKVDPHLKELLRFCEQENYPAYILSDGYEPIIQGVLQREGIKISCFCNGLSFDGQYRVMAPHYNPRCGRCGTCKQKLVERLGQPGARKIFVGDGYSDFCAAESCSKVFAKKNLLKYCLENQIPAHPYETLGEVLQWLRGEAEHGHPV
ncbi:MtnX-like HAD-IB family phosphatase [Desulforamulus ruminis]|uniref:2,3-diketo-5-methylthio-1-phosphopentane phosphatase n=1 Tax=Desulforamulus ruminis (strain ATCC 23193 / DSM 2154 / NCIMB 8452 / DL) TaxID=696281 RepID=F6DLZ1_DESRL|nr:MtnX-like HAD-IB family phosphatase [Desulforamulus ruminis]AEG58434.1 2,3-diketo-5-methylthio-1-phosphopentane phosphatase [Desulforamulus ruminis DSM 2154]